jgi:hypothetical protein
MRYEVMIRTTVVHYHTVEANSADEAEAKMDSLTEADFDYPHVMGSMECKATKLPPTLSEIRDALRESGRGHLEVE